MVTYSLYLSDYSSGAREHLSVMLINRDVGRPGLQVRLRLTIKGQGYTIQTLPHVVFAPITIDPGVPYRLSQQELAPYLRAANLGATGTGMQSYRNVERLPEGMTQFCFEVIEYASGRVLNLPFNKENITVRDPQNLLFQ